MRLKVIGRSHRSSNTFICEDSRGNHRHVDLTVRPAEGTKRLKAEDIKPGMIFSVKFLHPYIEIGMYVKYVKEQEYGGIYAQDRWA